MVQALPDPQSGRCSPSFRTDMSWVLAIHCSSCNTTPVTCIMNGYIPTRSMSLQIEMLVDLGYPASWRQMRYRPES